MKVQVIGYGVVGKAQEFLMKQLGHTVTAYDPFVLPDSKMQQTVDITFICTPEKAVEDAVANLHSSQVKGLYVIKSTVSVGTTKKLMEKYKVHICHNPEFLREKYAFEDVLNPSRIVIGECCHEHGLLLEEIYAKLNKPIYRTDPATSELAKLTSNAHLAMLISFWNEIHKLSSKLKLNTAEVAKLVTADPRISKYGTAFFGKPFNGRCLPKDLRKLILTFQSMKLNSAFFEAVEEVNERWRRHE
jgi:nucleotide sugar dehydrogenase